MRGTFLFYRPEIVYWLILKKVPPLDGLLLPGRQVVWLFFEYGFVCLVLDHRAIRSLLLLLREGTLGGFVGQEGAPPI